MSEYILSCCTTSDLTADQYKELGISYVPFKYDIDGEWRYDNPGEYNPYTFYSYMAEGHLATTVDSSIREYSDYFMNYMRQGIPVLHVTLSSGISDAYYVAAGAANVINSVYPEAGLKVIDSTCASSGFGLLMTEAARLKNEGYTQDELAEWIEANKTRVNHLFFSTDLSYLERSGRITKRAGFWGRKLSICPLMDVDLRGRLEVRKNVHKRENVYAETLKRMEKQADNGRDYDGPVFISTSDGWIADTDASANADANADTGADAVNEEAVAMGYRLSDESDAYKIADMIRTRFPKAADKIEIYPIGTTIGSHTGPGTTAVFFWGKERRS